MAVEYDEIGIWSEVKLAIVREYAAAYSKIMEAWRRDKIQRLSWIYIDAYAGPGYHLSIPTRRIATRFSSVTFSRVQDTATIAERCDCSTPTTSISHGK